VPVQDGLTAAAAQELTGSLTVQCCGVRKFAMGRIKGRGDSGEPHRGWLPAAW
jgi:hypothetical protein